MNITVKEVRTYRDRRAFLNVPYILHKDHELWVPPLRMLEKRYINPRVNPHIQNSKTILLLAYNNAKPVGRVMGIINDELIKKWNINQARFCNFESINNQEVAHKLLNAVEKWAKANDMDKVVGPLGFSNQDPQGFIVKGFDERPSIGTIYNFEYIPKLVEKEGYTKEVDYVTLKIPFPGKIPEIYEKISERLKKRRTLNIIEFSKKRDLKPWLPKIFRFMNETYTGIYGFIPLSEEAIARTTKTYNQIVDPSFVKIITTENKEIVGFVLGIRDITEGFKKAKGKLLPFGYFIIEATQKKAKRLDLLLGAIKKEYRAKGLDTLMAISMINSAKNEGMDFVDSHHELESNTIVQAEMKKMGGYIYKRHRVYKKEIIL